jgi:hypothetical protein
LTGLPDSCSIVSNTIKRAAFCPWLTFGQAGFNPSGVELMILPDEKKRRMEK